MVKSLLLLILVWLAFQFGALLLEARHPQSADSKAPGKPAMASVEAILRDWPTSSRAVAKDVMFRLGPPDVVKEDLLRWNRRSGVGLVLYREGIPNTVQARAVATSEPAPR